jgi:hypothetical protein
MVEMLLSSYVTENTRLRKGDDYSKAPECADRNRQRSILCKSPKISILNTISPWGLNGL